MNVAMIDPSAFTPPYDHHLCEGLSQRECDVTLFTTDFEYLNWDSETPYKKTNFFYKYTNQIYSDGTRSWHRKLIKGSEHITNMILFIRQIKQLDPDIIHFQWLPLPIFDKNLAKILKRIAPIVHTVHDTIPYHGASPSRLQKWGIRSAPKVFDKLIVHTKDAKSKLTDREIQESKISVVPHGPIHYPDSDQSDMDESVYESTNEQTILFFGGIKEYKGVDVLLRSFAGLPSELQNGAKLKIAGSASLEISELQELACELEIEDRVDWDIRYVPDEEVPRLFGSADIVVFPYRNADQSGALMTALPYGKPIIASDVGGFSKTLTDGIHGYLVEPENPDSLCAALENTLLNESKRNQMGEAVLRLSDNILSWEQIGMETIQVYKSTTQSSVSIKNSR